MRSEEEIRELYETWKNLRQELIECGDTVSLIVADQAKFFISTFEFVLNIDSEKAP